MEIVFIFFFFLYCVLYIAFIFCVLFNPTETTKKSDYVIIENPDTMTVGIYIQDGVDKCIP